MAGQRIPYFDFYPVDFMRGVRGLTAAEVGIYTMLLCRIYEENGPVEYHPVRLSAYCGVRESTLTKAVDRLIVLGRVSVENGMLSDERAMKEIGIRETKLKNSSRAGKASAEKRLQKQDQVATPVEQAFNHTDRDTDKTEEGSNEPLSENPTVTVDPPKYPVSPPKDNGPPFSAFWDVWPLGKICKQAAERAWRKLSAANRSLAIDRADAWAAQWRRNHPNASPIHPASYLNGKRWTDETQPNLTLIPGGPRDQFTREDHRAASRSDALRNQIDVAARMRRTPREDCF